MLKDFMKLSQIYDHNYDRKTDQLYQPLRQVIENGDGTMKASDLRGVNHLNRVTMRPDLKTSTLNISGIQQDYIRNATLIPINKKLVETNNPEKKIKARSRSYRTISVEQKIGSPMDQQKFKESIAFPRRTTEIVYDYQTPNQIKIRSTNELYKEVQYYGPKIQKTISRPRSETYLGPMFERLENRVERVESKTIQVARKPSQNSSTSLKLKEPVIQSDKNTKKNSQQISQYYQDCKKYTFRKEIKGMRDLKMQKSGDSKRKQQIITPRPRSNDYKYNLFSMLDQQTNLKCANGFCSKNQFIAPRIKKRW